MPGRITFEILDKIVSALSKILTHFSASLTELKLLGLSYLGKKKAPEQVTQLS